MFLQYVLAQVQNLTLRNHQGASSTSQSSGLQALSLKQTPISIQPTPLIKTLSSGAGKSNPAASTEDKKKGESETQTEMKAVNMSRSVSSSHPLIAPGTLRDYTQMVAEVLKTLNVNALDTNKSKHKR